MSLKIFEGKRVLVTGHTGFKGSWLLTVLNSINAKPYGYALAPLSGEMFSLINAQELCHHRIGDIRDKKSFRATILDVKPDIIFHLAAQPLVLESYADPLYTIETNVLGTTYLLETLRDEGLTVPTVVITTDKVYRNEEKGISFVESDPLGGNDVYSASKASSELIAHAYQNSFPHLNIVTARAGNVIGGGDYATDRIIPDIYRSYLNKNELSIRNPRAIRPWQHVLESLSGYLSLGSKMLNKNSVPKQINFGPNKENCIEVAQIITLFEKHLNSSIERMIPDQTELLEESKFLMLDSSKAQNELNWLPKWDLDYTIKKTVEWYKAPSAEKRQITINQIQDYFGIS